MQRLGSLGATAHVRSVPDRRLIPSQQRRRPRLILPRTARFLSRRSVILDIFRDRVEQPLFARRLRKGGAKFELHFLLDRSYITVPPNAQGLVQAVRIVSHLLKHHRDLYGAFEVVEWISVESVLAAADLTGEVAMIVVLGNRPIQDVLQGFELLILEVGLVDLLYLLILNIHRSHRLILLRELVE